MIQLTRNSPTNAYIAQKTVLRENRVMRNRVMRGLGVRHVTKQDVLELATLHYIFIMFL